MSTAPTTQFEVIAAPDKTKRITLLSRIIAQLNAISPGQALRLDGVPKGSMNFLKRKLMETAQVNMEKGIIVVTKNEFLPPPPPDPGSPFPPDGTEYPF